MRDNRQFASGVKPAPESEDQYAALCFREAGKRLEVLLITSRDTGRWVIPKGWPIAGLAPHETAAREAYEEAGAEGKIGSTCLGVYSYEKRLTNKRSVPCTVSVYPLRFRRFLKSFPEKGQRRSKWFAPAKAAAKVDESDLAALLAGFTPEARS